MEAAMSLRTTPSSRVSLQSLSSSNRRPQFPFRRSNPCSSMDSHALNAPSFPCIRAQQVLHTVADSININKKIWDMYFNDLLPRLAKAGSDGNFGSSAICDTICLQALSKRMHYGKFVAEAKFRASPDIYTAAIKEQLPHVNSSKFHRKCDLRNSIAIDGTDMKGYSLTESGVSTDIWTS